MRFSHLSVFALSGLTIASPVLSKRADATSLLNDLFATVQIYTGAINATLAPLSQSTSILEKTAATVKVGEQFNLITAAVTATTAEIQTLPRVNATEPQDIDFPTSLDTRSEPEEKRQLIAVGAILALIIVEIFATAAGAIAILGLAGLLIFLNPLTGAIAALILAVQLVLNVVLAGVIALLNSLLLALALGVSGL